MHQEISNVENENGEMIEHLATATFNDDGQDLH